jgi:hypothetical protein
MSRTKAIWRKGLRGVEELECVPISSLITPQPDVLDATDSIAMRSSDRNWLGEAMQSQGENGGVARKLFDELHAAGCTRAIRLEWRCMPTIELRPGMVEADVKRLARDSERIDAIQHARRIIKIWEAVRELIERGGNYKFCQPLGFSMSCCARHFTFTALGVKRRQAGARAITRRMEPLPFEIPTPVTHCVSADPRVRDHDSHHRNCAQSAILV